ncbi:Zn-dependent exopeptidase [Amniculicola lignicola CBS 123094]|uniref:Zn-dependent exopeptidase n=1 Tax=Amniculicola lignicola CBS 123094 TaxID=1392246 RepID=A0A6A5WG07_9PLEO|nr:Zn-dependent exopeptidase [Amniculicola lignicola CBS 123094]
MKLSAALLGFLPAAVLASDIHVAFYAREVAQLHNVIRSNNELDYGCRPKVLRASESEHKLHAYVTQEEFDALKRSLDPSVRLETVSHHHKRQAITAPIGKGDRFKGGKVAPLGIGTKKGITNAEQLGGILNYNEVYSAMKGLEKEYDIDLFNAPEKTYEGQAIVGGVANKAESKKCDKQYIYFTSGIHARERGGPDNLIYFISDLLYANKHRIGLKYGSLSFTNSDVKKVLGAGIVFIPMLNPDGVRHDQTNSNLWRKNRNPKSSTPGQPATVGVDLNRNFDFVWNYTKHFAPGTGAASNNPAAQTFYGTGPFSEPESRGMKWVYSKFPNIRWYIDLHSAVGDILYSWGTDTDQTYDPKMNFLNPKYDGLRGVIPDTATQKYKEYITEKDLYNAQLQANLTLKAIEKAGGKGWIVDQAAGLYPTSGATDDYSFSRWHANKKLNKVYGYTFEFAPYGEFYPNSDQYVQNIIETNAAFMQFVLNAVKIGLK